MAKPKTVNMYLNLEPNSPGHVAMFRLTKPDGTILRQSVMTAASGNTVAEFNLGPKYKTGTYLGHVDVTIGDQEVTADNSVVI